METARDGLNPYVSDLEDAQTEIRVIVKNAFISHTPRIVVEKRIEAAIKRATDKIVIPRLKEDARLSLLNFANKQRSVWQRAQFTPEVFIFLGAVMQGGRAAEKAVSKAISKPTSQTSAIVEESRLLNNALDTFTRQFWKEKVKPTLDELVCGVALDPSDFTGRNSLRNFAEMEVRYQQHQDDIQELRNKKVRLVICSAHADCSKRCAPYQGRVYSLDGTSGTTEDGKKYVPLEQATQNPDDVYITKAGRAYQNGLLGFNCRHKLYEYSGQTIPMVSAEKRKAEYRITQNQRTLEREVRQAKVEALMLKDVNKKAYNAARSRYLEAKERYIAYSRENNRAYYPTRIMV